MLSYALAIAVATISLVLFLTAFLMSDIHRKDDFLWSGVGFIYALVLWFCARNITGAVLLGQAAATAVLVSSTWQTLKLRRAIAHPDRAAEIYNFSVWQKIKGLLKRNQPQVKSAATSPVETPVTPKVTEQEIAIPNTPSEATESVEQAPTQATKTAPQANVPTTEPEVPQRATTKERATTNSPSVAPTKQSLETQDAPLKPTTSSKASQPEQSNTAQITETPKITQVEPQTETKDNSTEPATDSTAPIEPQVEPKPATVPPANKEIAKENGEPKAQTTSLEAKPVSEISPPETKDPASKTSSLDSLETVEVAEILEASAEDISIRETNDPNIIEVTTTEINITTEVKKIDEPEDNADSSD